MDALSDVLRVIRLSGGVFLEAEFTTPWCVSGKIASNDCKPFLEAPRHVIAYHFVAAGCMQLRPDGGDAIEVRAGEIVLLPHNSAHTFGSELISTPVPAREVMQVPKEGGLARIVHGGGGDPTQLLCGFLGCDTPFSPLLSALPPVLKLNVRSTASGAWIESSFRFAASQIAAGHLGSTTVIAKLSELLFVEAVSQFVASLPAERRGWLAGRHGRRRPWRSKSACHARRLPNASVPSWVNPLCSTWPSGACIWRLNPCVKGTAA